MLSLPADIAQLAGVLWNQWVIITKWRCPAQHTPWLWETDDSNGEISQDRFFPYERYTQTSCKVGSSKDFKETESGAISALFPILQEFCSQWGNQRGKDPIVKVSCTVSQMSWDPSSQWLILLDIRKKFSTMKVVTQFAQRSYISPIMGSAQSQIGCRSEQHDLLKSSHLVNLTRLVG